MRPNLTIVVVALLCGCTSMPTRFEGGDDTVHPRFGVEVTNETEDHFDIEVMVMDFSYLYTAGEDQVTRAKDIFMQATHDYAAKKDRTIEEPPRVELYMYQVRNWMDGTNSTRVSKRVRWRHDPGGAKVIREQGARRIAVREEEERLRNEKARERARSGKRR